MIGLCLVYDWFYPTQVLSYFDLLLIHIFGCVTALNVKSNLSQHIL